jgi:hypothetical protein
MSKKLSDYSTRDASIALANAIEEAIKNMTLEVEKVPDASLSGAARKAELKAVTETAIDCTRLILERQKLMDMVRDIDENGSIGEEKDFGAGFAEKHARKT